MKGCKMSNQDYGFSFIFTKMTKQQRQYFYNYVNKQREQAMEEERKRIIKLINGVKDE